MVKSFNYTTSQQAWEDINEYIFLKEQHLKSIGEGRDGNASICYDSAIFIDKAWVDPKFDFGKMFGYRIQKWSHLVNNYVNRENIKAIKKDIDYREGRKQRVYNVTTHFTNAHDNGKDCLISLTFSKRLGKDKPVLVFHTRATEVTKRLLIDLLLIQRIGEYIYPGREFSIVMYCPMAYLNAEAFTMYHTHRNIFDLLKKYQVRRSRIHNCYTGTEPFQARVIKILTKYLSCKPMDISYKSHRRAVRQLQGIDNNGNPTKLTLKAKNLSIKF